MTKKKSKFPVVKGGSRNCFPSKSNPICPVCGKKKVLEPHSMAIISAGALKLNKRKDYYYGPSEDMIGFLDLAWHGAHDGGIGEHSEVSIYLDIARDVKGGNFRLHFCSTKCLRSFLNECVDELENKIEEEGKAHTSKLY